MGSHHLVLPWIRPYLLSMFPTNPLQHRYPCSAHTIGYRHDGQISVPGGSSLWIFVLFPTLLHSYKDTKKSLKALFLNFQTFLQGTHIEPVGTHCEPPYLSPWLTKYSFKLCFFPFSSKYSIFFPWSQFKIHLFSKLNSPFIIRVSGTAFIAFHIFWAQLGHALKSF